MREILFLAHRLPYPPDRGDRIRSWHVLKALAQLAPVHVVALIDDETDRMHVPMVEQVAASVTAVLRTKSKASAIAEAIVTGRPASVAAFWDHQLARVVRQRLPSIDTIYAFSSQMAAYVPAEFAGRFVMDFVDVDSEKFAARGFFGNLEAIRLRRWEIATAMRADVSLFVSEAEAALFTHRSGLAVATMGNGIDTHHFAPSAGLGMPAPAPSIVFTGQMDYAPNVEAVTRFAKHELPKIRAAVPDAKFAIVGRAPTRAVRALASGSVIVTGEVADTRPWLAAASVVVVPLRIARGVQNKVLEAMAMARPCVISSDAAQGIDAADGRDFIVTDRPASAVVALLGDAERADRIGQAARKRMVENYAWDVQLAPLQRYVNP